MKLKILTPDRDILNADADSVTLPGRNGELTVLSGHTRLVTRLKAGNITYMQGGEAKVLALDLGALLEIDKDVLTVLIS